MERILQAMQHPVTGLPVESLKNFMTTVPGAFTGKELEQSGQVRLYTGIQ